MGSHLPNSLLKDCMQSNMGEQNTKITSYKLTSNHNAHQGLVRPQASYAYQQFPEIIRKLSKRTHSDTVKIHYTCVRLYKDSLLVAILWTIV